MTDGIGPVVPRPGDVRLGADHVDVFRNSGAARHLLDLPADCDEDLLQRSVVDLLAGRATPAVARNVAAILATDIPRLPPGFPELLRHEGVDPDSLLALSVTNERSFTYLVRDAGGHEIPVASISWGMSDGTWVMLRGDCDQTPRITWRDDHIHMPALPEAVSSEIVGMPLKALLSHPALDPLDIAIVRISPQWEDHGYIEVTTSLHQARTDELDAADLRIADLFEPLVDGRDDLVGLKTLGLGGLTKACLLTGHAAVEPVVPIGVNGEVLRDWTDARIVDLLRDQIAKWRQRYGTQAA